MEQTTNHKLLFCIVIFLAVGAFFISKGNQEIIKREQAEEARFAGVEQKLSETPVLAKALSVYNITKNRKLYGKNDELALPLASIAKIMTVSVALSSYGPDDTITLSPNAIRQAGDFGLRAGERWRIEDLAKLTLISSANDAAFAFGESNKENYENFLNEMNARARRIGAGQTSFANVTGLDINNADQSVEAGVFASALDANMMASYALLAHRDVFMASAMPEINLSSVDGVERNFKNTNTIIPKIPNLILSKTGYTVVAGGNLTIVFQNALGEEVAVTVLGSTFEGRFTDMEKLVEVLYSM